MLFDTAPIAREVDGARPGHVAVFLRNSDVVGAGWIGQAQATVFSDYVFDLEIQLYFFQSEVLLLRVEHLSILDNFDLTDRS